MVFYNCWRASIIVSFLALCHHYKAVVVVAKEQHTFMCQSSHLHIICLSTSSLGIYTGSNPSHHNHNTLPNIDSIDHAETYHIYTIAEQIILKQSPNLLALVLDLAHTSFLVIGNQIGITQHQLTLLVARLQFITVDITKGPKL